MLEFRINDFITLRLEEFEEEQETNIYILGERFIQCKYLLMNVPVRDIGLYDEIASIDEVAEKLDKFLDLGNLEGYEARKEIPPEVEFWGHCSNLQAWSEQNYDTCFIHSNLAFPLLKKLTEVGDPKAERVFKDEIGKRFDKGPDSVRQYLVLERYMDFLSRAEMWSVIPNQLEVKILHAIERETGVELKLCSDKTKHYTWGDVPNQIGFSFKDDFVKAVDFLNCSFSDSKWEKIFVLLGKLSYLKELYLSNNSLTTVPDGVKHLESLTLLKMDHNELKEIPKVIGDLKKLKKLNLNDNRINELPESIGGLQFLEELYINRNQLSKLPDSIGNLKSLVKLFLKNNCLESLPNTIVEMESLTQLALSSNFLSTLPEKIIEMKAIKGIDLKGNMIEKDSFVITILERKGIVLIF